MQQLVDIFKVGSCFGKFQNIYVVYGMYAHTEIRMHKCMQNGCFQTYIVVYMLLAVITHQINTK